jgi:micrococcal nuclease
VRPRRQGAWRGLALLALAPLALLGDCGEPEPLGSGDTQDGPRELGATVTEVIDGDTIEVRLDDGTFEDVRYIGVDTPESVDPDQPVQCFGRRAARANEAMVGGRRVLLRFDAERRDRYGRLLAYVSVGRRLVNAALARRGLARTLTIAPNDSLAPLFARLAGAAGRAGRGLWGAC